MQMSKLKGIKRLVSYGLITLIGFNLFVGCEDNNQLEPIEFILESNTWDTFIINSNLYELLFKEQKNSLNSLIAKYDKIKLVPFGEFLPFENILKRIGLRSITINYYSYSNIFLP